MKAQVTTLLFTKTKMVSHSQGTPCNYNENHWMGESSTALEYSSLAAVVSKMLLLMFPNSFKFHCC